jgi:predicted anti-sigma-YlaC factor YlaD
MGDDGMNCEALERALHEGRRLTAHELAHVEDCDECMDVWLTLALEAKPEVAVPADFAARVAASVPPRRVKRVALRVPRHWGLITAMAVVTVVLVVGFPGPKPANSWVGLVFVMVVASEIAGLALWLGPRWLGR